jgi:hypothetical protein
LKSLNNLKIPPTNINLTNGTVGSQYYVGYASNKQLNISFGPMDVKVLKFASTPPDYNNGWEIAWSNFGSGNISGHNVKGLFKWNGNDFIWDWSDYGSNHAIRPYRTNMLPGDFDGDGKVEMLGFDGWSTLFHFDNGNWQWGWSTYGANNFNGWTYPLLVTDRILAGNLDSDNKDELFFLQTHSTAAWATTMDLKNDQSGWNWNWSANQQYSLPFIDDWPLAANGGSNTRYYLVKAKSNEPKYLLAMRKFCGNYLVNMYKTNSSSNYKMANVNIEDNFNSFESDNDISVFPNPTDGKIQIIATKSGISHIEVLDPRGQIIYNAKYNSQQNAEIDLSKYPTGIYILKLTDSQNSVSIRKIILNK